MVVPSLQQNNILRVDMSSTTIVDNGLSCGFRGKGAFDCYMQEDDETVTSSSDQLTHPYPLHQILEDFSLLSIVDRDDANELERQIKNMIYENPLLLETFNDRGLTALHVACMEGASLSVIEALVESNTSSVVTLTRNKKKLLPLHLVCRYYSGQSATFNEIVHFLLSVYPDSVKTLTASGELALHLCCQNPFCTLSLIKTILHAFPEAVRLPSARKRQLPLHLACEQQFFNRLEKGKNLACEGSNTSDAIIRFFVEMNTESVLWSDKKGFLPIHAAAKGYQAPTTLKYLLSVYPDSIQFVDDKGRTPLHICVGNAAPDFVAASVFLTADPSALIVEDNNQSTPLHYAVQGGQLDLIFALTLNSPTSLDILRTRL